MRIVIDIDGMETVARPQADSQREASGEGQPQRAMTVERPTSPYPSLTSEGTVGSGAINAGPGPSTPPLGPGPAPFSSATPPQATSGSGAASALSAGAAPAGLVGVSDDRSTRSSAEEVPDEDEEGDQ